MLNGSGVSPDSLLRKKCGRKGRGANQHLKPVLFSKTQHSEHKFSTINDPLRSHRLLFHHSGFSNGPRWSFNLCKMQEKKSLQATVSYYFPPIRARGTVWSGNPNALPNSELSIRMAQSRSSYLKMAKGSCWAEGAVIIYQICTAANLTRSDPWVLCRGKKNT